MAWWYLSFGDPQRPVGTQWLGSSIVGAASAELAVAASHNRGCNPGGHVSIALVPSAFGQPPDRSDHRLHTDRAELERIFQVWSGQPDDRMQKLADLQAEGADLSRLGLAHAVYNKEPN